MRRYKFLTKENVYEALNRLRAAFLAAKDGHEVEEIIKGIFTHDERMKIGRRILIAQLIKEGRTLIEISKLLKVGKNTIIQVQRKLESNPLSFELINRRSNKVEEEYKRKAYRKVGGPKLIFKRREYTGFSRKDVKR